MQVEELEEIAREVRREMQRDTLGFFANYFHLTHSQVEDIWSAVLYVEQEFAYPFVMKDNEKLWQYRNRCLEVARDGLKTRFPLIDAIFLSYALDVHSSEGCLGARNRIEKIVLGTRRIDLFVDTGLPRGGAHYILGLDNLLIDPTISQFLPGELRRVFKAEEYPFPISNR